jgi:regulatory protein
VARHGAETDPAVVLAAAMRLLEVRSRTVKDLQSRLLRSGYSVALVDGATERLVELGLLDDEAYARGWLESRDRGRPRGERVLRQELRLRGVPGDLAAAALDERRAAGAAAGDNSESGSADEAAAIHLLDRRAAALTRVTDPRARRQRAYALLARNGFDPDVASRVAARFMRPVDLEGEDG